MGDVVALVLLALAATAAGSVSGGFFARAASDLPGNRAVLPCGRDVVLTAVYRNEGRIRFEGVVTRGLEGEDVRIERKSGETVTRAVARRDGTFWAVAETSRMGYTWLSRFTAYVRGEPSRARRLGQAVAVRERAPLEPRGGARIKIKVSGNVGDHIVVGRQRGCSRYEVSRKFRLRTDPDGVAEITLPRPPEGDPYSIYRVSTIDGWKISPPIVVQPAAG